MPDETVIDGEVVALDRSVHPSLNALQNYGLSTGPLLYYVFDFLRSAAMVLRVSRFLQGARYSTRKSCQRCGSQFVNPRYWMRACRDLIHAVKTQSLEGLIAKRKSSRYEPGQRSGAWQKMRVK
jgi:bifunctional non-homologous end joining protein LigD